MFSLRASNIAIVLDNSASMQTLENQQTRFALAQEKRASCSPTSAPPGRSIFTLPHHGWKKCAAPPLNRPKPPESSPR